MEVFGMILLKHKKKIIILTKKLNKYNLYNKSRMKSNNIKYCREFNTLNQKAIEIVEQKNKEINFIPYQNINNQFQIPPGQQKYQQSLTRNRLKGAKYKLSDARIKQKIKDRCTHNKSVLRASSNLFHQNTFEILTQLNRKESEWTGQERQCQKSKTRASTCDASINMRKNLLGQKNEQKKKKKGLSFSITTHTHVEQKHQTVRSFFNSSNLGNKMNDYMNLMIRNQYKSQNDSQKLINKIHTEGMVPHARKLNNFERKMKLKNKVKSLSNEKIKAEYPSVGQNLNKTIETVLNKKERGESPLVYKLEYKTIFGKLSLINNSKQKYFKKL